VGGHCGECYQRGGGFSRGVISGLSRPYLVILKLYSYEIGTEKSMSTCSFNSDFMRGHE